MAKFDKAWKGMLDELMLDESDTMTDWETKFVESLHQQSGRSRFGREPTPKQLQCLDKIWAKVFG
jgi:hypothetical protein